LKYCLKETKVVDGRKVWSSLSGCAE